MAFCPGKHSVLHPLREGLTTLGKELASSPIFTGNQRIKELEARGRDFRYDPVNCLDWNIPSCLVEALTPMSTFRVPLTLPLRLGVLQPHADTQLISHTEMKSYLSIISGLLH